MRHLHLVAAIDGAGGALLLVDAQHIAEIGRAVAEDREIFAHAPLEQAEHQRFRQRARDQLAHAALGERLLHAAGFGDRARVRASVGRCRLRD